MEKSNKDKNINENKLKILIFIESLDFCKSAQQIELKLPKKQSTK